MALLLARLGLMYGVHEEGADAPVEQRLVFEGPSAGADDGFPAELGAGAPFLWMEEERRRGSTVAERVEADGEDVAFEWGRPVPDEEPFDGTVRTDGERGGDVTMDFDRPWMAVGGLVAHESAAEWRAELVEPPADSPAPLVRMSTSDGTFDTPVVEMGGPQRLEEREEPPEEEVSAVAGLLAGLEAGSRREAEVQGDIKEAQVLWTWLKTRHSDWLQAMGVASRISCEATAKDVATFFFAKKGKAYCSKARRGVECYERFVAANSSRISSGGAAYPPSVELVAWCILWTTDVSRARHAKAALKGGVASLKAFKGTAGKAQQKALAYAHKLFRAPFTPLIMTSEEVKMAALKPTEAEGEPEEEAHAGAFIQCWMEEVGGGGVSPKGEAYTEQQLDYARGFAVEGVAGLRTCEVLRSKVPPGGVDTRSDKEGPVVLLRCAGGKAPRLADIKPFDAAVPMAGFTPFMGEWALDWARAKEGKPYIFRAFKKTGAAERSKGKSVAAGWTEREESATPEMVGEMFVELVELIGMSRERRVKAGLTAYGMRHLLPDLARAAGWSLTDRTELGRWAPSVIRDMVALEMQGGVAAKRRAPGNMRFACANLYSRGNAALGREVRLRRDACWLVRGLVGDKEWRSVVPVELEGPPKFQWVAPLAQLVDDEEWLPLDEEGTDID